MREEYEWYNMTKVHVVEKPIETVTVVKAIRKMKPGKVTDLRLLPSALDLYPQL